MVVMNPNRGENVQMEAPIIQPEGPETADGHTPEARPAYHESSPAKQSSPLAVTPSTVALPNTQVPSIPSDDDITVDNQIRTSESTNNAKLEKQWIDKTKAVVAKTKDDPYQQNNEISKVKADYIKTRFNKIVHTKTGDS